MGKDIKKLTNNVSYNMCFTQYVFHVDNTIFNLEIGVAL